MFTFKQGIHPPENKGTGNDDIKVVMPKDGALLYYPVIQHIGKPCKPIVKIGDHVLMGQKIAEADGFVSSAIFASISGTIKGIERVITPSGIVCDSIVLENDNLFTEIDTMKVDNNWERYSKEEKLEMIRDAGIVGLGGAGFPTHVKLSPNKPIEYIIVNAAECEPYLTNDDRIMQEHTEYVIEGLRIVLTLFDGAKGIIGIENNKPDAIKALQKYIDDNKIQNVSIYELKPKYPQGAEKQLIYSITKREVPSGKLPADIGCIVNNVDTIVAIHRAIIRRRPLMRRVVTLAGGAVKNPGNYKVRLGMTLQDLIEASGGLITEPKKLIAGGPMMGASVYDLHSPIIKTTNGMLVLSEEEVIISEEKNCIRCGKCVSVCPAFLMPLELNKYAINDVESQFLKYNGLDCIACASCSYICPAKRHLAQSIVFKKNNILINRAKKSNKSK